MMLKSSLFLASLPAVVFAACHDVKVGDGGLNFSPNTLVAAAGDTVNFHFYPGDHGVASSQFSAPCVASGDMWSGFINPTSGVDSQMYTITITDTSPLFLFCPQIDHCQSGMAIAINPSSTDTIAAYQKAAANAMTKAPSTVGGGTLGANAMCAAAPVGSSSAASSAAASSAPAKSSAAATSAAATSAPAKASTPAAGSSSPAPSPVTTPSASPAPVVGPTPATTSGSPTYTGAANSNKNGAVAMVAAAAGAMGLAMI